MLNSDFDPYEELMIARHNINELIQALNTQSGLFRELSQQHQQLATAIKSQSQTINQCLTQNRRLNDHIQILREELNQIKNSQKSPD